MSSVLDLTREQGHLQVDVHALSPPQSDPADEQLQHLLALLVSQRLERLPPFPS
ncbi:hypothetical protein AB0C74_33595 [Spirillospora sp. NPDC048832]